MQTLYLLAKLHEFSCGAVLLCLESFLSLLSLIPSGTYTLSSPFTSIILCHCLQSFPYIKQPVPINYLCCALLHDLLLYNLVNFIVNFMPVYFCFILVFPHTFFFHRLMSGVSLNKNSSCPGRGVEI